WKNGRTAMTRSSGAAGIAPSVWATLATRFRWVSMTPFASPVVPDEYGSATTSSGSTGTCPAGGGPYSALNGLTGRALSAQPGPSTSPASPSTYTSATELPAQARTAASTSGAIVT